MKKMVLVASLILSFGAFAESDIQSQIDQITRQAEVRQAALDRLAKELYISRDSGDQKDINGWQIIKCNKDKFNNIKNCILSKANLMVSIDDGKTSIFISGGDYGHYPNSQSAIKIDENNTIYGIEGSFSNNLKIINQMLKGDMVFTRYKDWPNDFNNDLEISLNGFTEAYDALRKKYSLLK